MKNILIIIIVAVAVGGGVWWYMNSQKNTQTQTQEGESTTGEESKEKEVVVVDKAKTEIFSVKSKLTVIVFDKNNAQYAIQIGKVSFEVSNSKSSAELEKIEAKVVDIINTVISSKSYEDVILNDRDHSLLKNELKTKVGEVLSQGRVVSVFFENFVFQALK